MKKTNKIFEIKTALLLSVLVLSLFALGNISTTIGQSIPQKEICNGKDDNGDGQIDEGINCDHYLSYLVDTPINPIGVVLKDQFLDPTDFKLTLINRLLNPAVKLHSGMVFNPKKPDLHYLAYRLETPIPFTPHHVLIENQFEKRIISAIKPSYLLTPTGKRKMGIPIDTVFSHLPALLVDRLITKIVPPIPQNANHYLCYDVEPYDIAANVLAKDQFQQGQFKVIQARYLCNPVEKIHNGRVNEIVDENNHIMCYEVIPHNNVNRKVITHDQFGIKLQNALRTEEICVPTMKTHITPPACVQPDSDGTVVILDNTTRYQNTNGATLMAGPDTVITKTGSPSGGETYTFDTEMLQMTLSGTGHALNIPVSGQMVTDPRTPGDPVQSFTTDMVRLQGQLPPGDPDFDLLRITAGTDFGLPSPGHTTLTQLPDGNWNVDSFFDITYRIDFVGAPGGSLAGQSGSNVGTVRLANTCL